MEKNEAGFTLLEVMVSIFISTILLFSVFYIMSMAETVFRSNDMYYRLDQDAMQTLRSISREIGQTSPNAAPAHLVLTTDANANTVVRFQIPVDWDNDGDADTGGLNPQAEWGAYDSVGTSSSGRLGAWVRYSVNSSNQLSREVLDSSLATIASATKIIANNIQTFTVSKSQSNLTMTATLRSTDTIGKKGTSSRQFNATVNTTTMLRNAVT